MSSPQQQFVAYRALVGQAVAQRRNQLQIGQTPMANELGITQASFSRLESGQTAFTVEQLAVIAARLGVTPSQLLATADTFEARLKQQGYTVLRSAKEPPKELSPLAGAALVAALLALLFSK